MELLFRVSAENAHGVSDAGDVTDSILTVDASVDGDDVFSDGKHPDSDGKFLNWDWQSLYSMATIFKHGGPSRDTYLSGRVGL